MMLTTDPLLASNGWSYTSPSPVRLHGVDRENINLLYFLTEIMPGHMLRIITKKTPFSFKTKDTKFASE